MLFLPNLVLAMEIFSMNIMKTAEHHIPHASKMSATQISDSTMIFFTMLITNSIIIKTKVRKKQRKKTYITVIQCLIKLGT